MPAKSFTLYAKWLVNGYTITFNSNGGTPVADLSAEFGASITAPTPPTREGYNFEGWYENSSLTGNKYVFTTMPAKNFMLYAK